MESELTLGYYANNAQTDSGTPIYEVTATEQCMLWLKEKSKECQYTKADDSKPSKPYSNFKSLYLPIIFFTLSGYRPDKQSPVIPSGFCCLDIDDTDTRFEITHPAVFAINYTSNGTHIIAHSSNGWGSTNKAWQETYDKMAYEIQRSLENTYGVVKFDGMSSKYYQGCYVWKTDWWFNPHFDPSYVLPNTYLTGEQIKGLYIKKRNPVKSNTVKTVKGVKEVKTKSEIMTELTDYIGIPDEAADDFLSMQYNDFLWKYHGEYGHFEDEQPDFKWVKTYNGKTYLMCKTNGTLLKFWLPFMVKGARGMDCKIKKGNRRLSVFNRALSTAQYSGDNLNPVKILTDAVWWYVTWCDRSVDELDKQEFLENVINAIAVRNSYERRPMVDKRGWISGEFMIDLGTGELIPMEKGQKIAACQECRKTERIEDMLQDWNSSLPYEDSISDVMSWCGIKSRKTAISYLKTAKANEEYLLKFPFLNDIEIKEGRGRSPKELTIEDIASGEVYSFKSHKECMAYLGINKASLSRFLKGKSRLNKKYKVLRKLIP